MSDLTLGTVDLKRGREQPAGAGLARAAHYLRIPPIETYGWAIAFAKTIPAKLIFVIAVAAVLLIGGKSLAMAFAIAAAAGACSCAGRYRPYILTLSTLGVLLVNPNWFEPAVETITAQTPTGETRIVAMIVVIFATALLLQGVPWLRGSVIFRRPVLSLFALYTGLVLLASSAVFGDTPSFLWALIAAFSGYFWFLSYALVEATRSGASSFVQLGTFHTAWNWSEVPFGKGATYLRKFEAKDAHELAVTQLKGLKLLVWACVLKGALLIFRKAIYGILGIPTLQAAFTAHVAEAALPVGVCWLSLLASFAETLLVMASWGHAIVAVARIAGYRLLRNTHKPLSSRTLAEFWNRYYFYFKELLVDLFFYPTFLRWFRGYPRLRLAFATFMAAGVGNAIYHFMREIAVVKELGLAKAVTGYQTYVFYCALLALGIVVSQLRKHEPKPKASFVRARLWPAFCVLGFFCLLHVFDDMGRDTTLMDHFAFLFHLFYIDMIGS